MAKLKFEEYAFEVINIESKGNNLLTLNKNSLTFDRSVAEALGYPGYVKPLLDRDNKVFAIQVCKANSLNSIPFSKPETKQKGSVKLQYSAIKNSLRIVMGDQWQEAMRYQLKGTYIPEQKAMIFELNHYEELPSAQTRKNER